ncbi:hypothetical protein [Methylobacterium sp. 77]|uniref:hypothetical protein n=1 Tax=Methylobacterium sp. 77 TaxID=1101192 RepID=UPI000375E233|nr:hypothetical protein [Methylobacterium sp. 77]
MALQPIHRFRRPGIAALAAVLIIGAPLAWAAAPGVFVKTATGRSSAVTSPRIALLIVPQASTTGSRAATAHADEEAYRKRLLEIGFDVWTFGPADRPELERSLREAAGRIPEGAQVAVIALGQSIGGEDDVFLVPGNPADLAQRPNLVDSDGVRLGDLMRRLSRRQLRDLVAVIDECQPTAGGSCDFDGATGGSGASVMGAQRAARRAPGAAPLAGRASLRDVLLGAMAQEGQNFLQSYEFLQRGLADSDLEPRASGSLTTTFAFLPQGFFAGMTTGCNKIDPDADAAALRTVALDPPIRECEAMTAAYPYARHFADRLQAGREQRAYQKAVASCEDRLSAPSYLSAYPAGRFRGIVEGHILECDRVRDRQQTEEDRRRRDADDQRRRWEEQAERERQLLIQRRSDAERQRELDAKRRAEAQQLEEDRRRAEEDRLRQLQNQRSTARSASGWNLNYSSALLEIKPMADDHFDAQKQSYSTVWQSRQHGEQVAIYVQVSPNERCGDARQYMSEQITPRRTQVSRSQEITSAPGRSGYVLEGRGTARGQGAFDDRSFYDFVSIRRDDRSTITHIGGRFPAEYSDIYRPELLKMMNSMQLPGSDMFTNRCR